MAPSGAQVRVGDAGPGVGADVETPVEYAPVSSWAETGPEGEGASSDGEAGAEWASTPYDAQVLAFETGAPVEDLSQRTPNRRVWALPDATWVTDVASGNNDVLVSGDGTNPEDWAVEDLTLEFADDGLVRPRIFGEDAWFTAGGAATEDIRITGALVTEGLDMAANFTVSLFTEPEAA